jgi:ribosomal protein S18 acetylase RimI-like enzyme
VYRFYQDWVCKAVLGTFDDVAYLLRDQGRPVGFCTVRFEPCSRASIGLVGLDPAYSGRRLGG